MTPITVSSMSEMTNVPPESPDKKTLASIHKQVEELTLLIHVTHQKRLYLLTPLPRKPDSLGGVRADPLRFARNVRSYVYVIFSIFVTSRMEL